MQEHRQEPPILLAIGLALTVVKTVLSLLGLAFFALISVGVVSASVLPGVLEESISKMTLGVAGGAAVAVMIVLTIPLAFKLVVCWKSWQMRRNWLIVLIVISVIGILLEIPASLGCCLLPTLIDIILLIGAVQALNMNSSTRGPSVY